MGEDPNNRCGYFDNGYDKEHEHRVNCRACLLARVQELEAEHFRYQECIDTYVVKLRETSEEVQELEREVARLKGNNGRGLREGHHGSCRYDGAIEGCTCGALRR